ncbi:MAG: hydroxymethylbilane synthase [Candidatus Methanomethylophilaceae archaeon]|nr:hydroxymethylbilane synthase [Candidatus Methanomethylophilaceae archaeon]MDY0224433.1 hydroxymethylbilane synthase [Candidatus Methanomethylophilaceae archaeon]
MIIGSRESKLAMKQTEMFMDRMKRFRPEIEFKVIGMKSLGDIDLTSPLNELNNIGAFVKELDDAILRKEIDVSVNSLKDIPIDTVPGIIIGAILPRNSVEDVILPCSLDDLPIGATIGTASVRREAELKSIRPDLQTKPLRGNIHTRLAKLDSGECDAIILAKAGLDRMGIVRPMFILDPEVFIPAPAQGAIAVECRSDDTATLALLKEIDDAETRKAVEIERAIMSYMGAGCSSPVGINVKFKNNGYFVKGVSFSFTVEPRRLSVVIPVDYTSEDLKRIADYLIGKIQDLKL